MINYSDLTFVIVTFKSEYIIKDCLGDIPEECKKIIVENSGNYKFYEKLKNDISNLEVFIMEKNCGYGSGNNLGILNSSTNYVFIINPDTKILKSDINKILNIIEGVDFAIAAPRIIEKSKVYMQNNENKDFISVNQVPGMAMLLNKKKFSNSFFDENFFLYCEEIDLCKRLKNKGEKIIEINVEVSHLGNQSHGGFNLEIEKSRNWHWMWSKFYYSKKYRGYFLSLITFSPVLVKLIFRLFFYYILRNDIKFILFKKRLSGLLASIRGKSSYYRPQI